MTLSQVAWKEKKRKADYSSRDEKKGESQGAEIIKSMFCTSAVWSVREAI